jgi:hypothetical protein
MDLTGHFTTRIEDSHASSEARLNNIPVELYRVYTFSKLQDNILVNKQTLINRRGHTIIGKI